MKTIIAIILMLSVFGVASASQYNPEYMLLKGELACVQFTNENYQCLDLKAPKGAASHVVIMRYTELKQLGAVPGKLVLK